MQQRTTLIFLALGIFSLSSGCPFHAYEQEEASYNNRRRSFPGVASRTSINDVRVFNGWTFDLPSSVCLDYGYIVDVGNCDRAKTHISGTGKFLIPGLIDSHIHLTDLESLENYTSYGCTTAMDMNCRNATQCNLMANQPGLASFVRAGRSSVGKGSAHEKQDPSRPKNTLIYPDTNVRQFVEWQFNNGSDFHKITAELNGPSTQQQKDMVKAAHYLYQKQTMTHAADIMAYHQAIESLTDGIQHVPQDGILDNATISRIKAQNQFVTPTLNIFTYAFSDPVFSPYFNLEPGSNRTLEHAEINAKNLYQAGVAIIAGTDSVGPITINGTATVVPFGLTLHYELEHLVQVVGMSPAEAINAATREAAKWHRIMDRGSVEVGKRADLVMLNSDPLERIENTRDIEKVWAFGVEVSHVTRLG